MLSFDEEFLFATRQEGPVFLWLRSSNCLLCFLEGLCGYAVSVSPLSHNNMWAGIDLIQSLHHKQMYGEEKVIGFDLLHVAPATGLIPRLFLGAQEETLSLSLCVSRLDALLQEHGPQFGFFEYKDLFTQGEIPETLQLSTYDMTKDEAVPVTRELFLKYGGRLLV